jgi:hypothetical protein
MQMQTTSECPVLSTADLESLVRRVADDHLSLSDWSGARPTPEVLREAEAFVEALRVWVRGLDDVPALEIRRRGAGPVLLTLLDLDDDLWYGICSGERRRLLELLEVNLDYHTGNLYEALVAAAYETTG